MNKVQQSVCSLEWESRRSSSQEMVIVDSIWRIVGVDKISPDYGSQNIKLGEEVN